MTSSMVSRRQAGSTMTSGGLVDVVTHGPPGPVPSSSASTGVATASMLPMSNIKTILVVFICRPSVKALSPL